MMADNIWDGWDGYYRSLLEQHLVRSFWANAAGGFSADFGAYVDSIAAQMQ
jgi:hypothetical protein